ncbi:hypothetical protein OG746_14860 [Streptomyces sp. NBC_01016]|uniref:hypothetical protein n=1 Tax=Streptomyces sp. NBC_01016 TaxID=2903720 RepID=UPI00225839F3|nr:hypothetical protein [Streptomyces sp. NBC_01016]MCX4830011.1 hypothetical protein [Streptomyces sp. NBC_01016]
MTSQQPSPAADPDNPGEGNRTVGAGDVGGGSGRWLFVLHLTVCGLLAVVSALAWITGADVQTVATLGVGGIVAVVAVLIPIVAAKDDTEALKRHVRPFITALGIGVILFALVSVVGFGFREAGATDVTPYTELDSSAQGMTAGNTAALTVEAEPDGAELRVVLGAEDLTAGSTPCQSSGRLEFHGTDLEESQTVDLAPEVTVSLPLDTEGATVQVDITMHHDDPGCRITLGVEKSEYL